MFYVWVAAGGALGSMARAWMALVVARITGPQFPWGTILINIIGSFVLGFFGTLTTTNSRFSVPADIRAFVMVGICGGFTTFSSFSLQTLELARDGRMLQALGNIGLSVALCLMAVTAGHYGAIAIHGVPVKATVAQGETMGEVVLAVLNRPDEAGALLDASRQLLHPSGGRLRVLAIRPPPAAALLPSEEVLTADRAASIRAEREGWSGQLRAGVESWAANNRPQGIRTEWLDPDGDTADLVTEHSRGANAIVLTRPAGHEREWMHDALLAALFETEIPVLAVPPGFHEPFGQVVAIAWKDDPQAQRAVRSGLPILRRARRVHVLCAGTTPALPSVLSEQAIAADLHVVGDGPEAIGERILHAAHQCGADLIVMGAFSHRPWRERMFGGVTRTMLAEADLPLLMRH